MRTLIADWPHLSDGNRFCHLWTADQDQDLQLSGGPQADLGSGIWGVQQEYDDARARRSEGCNPACPVGGVVVQPCQVTMNQIVPERF